MKKLLARFKDFSLLVVRSFKQFSRNGEARFRLVTAFKLSSISMITFATLVFSIYGILAIDLIFFQAQGYPGAAEYTEVFYDFLLASFLEHGLFVALSLISIFLLGIYIGDLLLRPFRLIGEYCEAFVNHRKVSYDPDFFSDLKLLANFSDYFFHLMENFYRQKQLPQIEVPAKYSRIHQPVFEKGFFLQFFLLISVVSIVTGILQVALAVGVYEGLVELSQRVIPNTNEVKYFLTSQSSLWDRLLYIIISVHLLLYALLSFHLYAKVSVPAFGIFATMRAFLRGNYSNRVHLIGYYYIRPQYRQFNKYLDFMQRELSTKD